MKVAQIAICSLFLTLLSSSLVAQDKAATAASAREFVQQFYTWYVPVVLGQHKEPSSNIALRDKKAAFSSELYAALKADWDAQANVKDDIVGLDFDPFLNTQDPCKRYELGKITQAGNGYRVEVFGICSGKRSSEPEVAPEVQWANGHWEFANFYYPNMMKDDPKNANLLATLKLLSDERQKEAAH